MSKLTKLVKKPGLFARDWLIKRHPIDFKNHVGQASTGRHLVDVFPVEFPIDVVYTWVDGADPAWRAQKAQFLGVDAPDSGIDEDTADLARFQSHDELRYSLRSIEQYAPWVRHIYLVTEGHRPSWLVDDHAKLTVVPHKAIIDAQFLPTFNSHVLEAHLHRIAGLSEHYVYFNDDVLLSRPLQPSDFFLSTGARLVSPSGKVIPSGPPTSADTPMDCASKNTRALIEATFGQRIDAGMLHSFHCQTKTTAARCIELIEDAGLSFYGNRFRSLSDLNTATLLSHYVAWFTGSGVFSPSSCMYLNMHSASSAQGYQAMLDLKGQPACPDSLCVNQVANELGEAERDAFAASLREFFDAYYPEKSSFER